MIKKLLKWLKRNSCIECKYYHKENNTCQSKKCATCGCHPYVNWFDRHFCEPYKAEREEMQDVVKRKAGTPREDYEPLYNCENWIP